MLEFDLFFFSLVSTLGLVKKLIWNFLAWTRQQQQLLLSAPPRRGRGEKGEEKCECAPVHARIYIKFTKGSPKMGRAFPLFLTIRRNFPLNIQLKVPLAVSKLLGFLPIFFRTSF